MHIAKCCSLALLQGCEFVVIPISLVSYFSLDNTCYDELLLGPVFNGQECGLGITWQSIRFSDTKYPSIMAARCRCGHWKKTLLTFADGQIDFFVCVFITVISWLIVLLFLFGHGLFTKLVLPQPSFIFKNSPNVAQSQLNNISTLTAVVFSRKK